MHNAAKGKKFLKPPNVPGNCREAAWKVLWRPLPAPLRIFLQSVYMHGKQSQRLVIEAVYQAEDSVLCILGKAWDVVASYFQPSGEEYVLEAYLEVPTRPCFAMRLALRADFVSRVCNHTGGNQPGLTVH